MMERSRIKYILNKSLVLVSLSLIVSVSNFSFAKYSSKVTVPSDTDPRLLAHVESWTAEKSLIHMHNHRNNNMLMLERLLSKYLDKGVPAHADAGRKAFDGYELRRALGIPIDVWHNPMLREMMIERLTKFMSLHDIAKVNTSDSFLRQNEKILNKQDGFHVGKGVRKTNSLVIEKLNNTFGVNFYADKKVISKKVLDQRKNGHALVQVVNQIDGQAHKDFLLDKKLLPIELQGKWLDDLAYHLENIIDKTERWGNPLSRVEFLKKMVRGSDYEFKDGQKVRRTDYHTPLNALQFHLEEDYHLVATHFSDAFINFKKFFQSLNAINIDNRHLDPLKKYEIFLLLGPESRQIANFSSNQLKQTLLIDNFQLIKDITKKFDPRARNMLAQLDRFRSKYLVAKDVIVKQRVMFKLPRAPDADTLIPCFEASLTNLFIEAPY